MGDCYFFERKMRTLTEWLHGDMLRVCVPAVGPITISQFFQRDADCILLTYDVVLQVVTCDVCARGTVHEHASECRQCKRRITVADPCPLDLVTVAVGPCPTVLPDGTPCTGRRNVDFA